MRLTQKKIEETIVAILGEEGLVLLKHLAGKENVSEFDLASKAKKDIKVIRKMLYILYNHNLVGFTRKKDKQKGWYVYYWTILLDSLRFNYIKRKKEHLAKLKQRLEEETKELFFVCPNNCVRLNFDQSMDFEFHCPECGELISQDSTEAKVKELKNKVQQIEEELEKIRKVRQVKRSKVKERKKVVKVRKKVTRKKAPATKKKPVRKVTKKKAVKRKVAKKVVKKKGPVKKKVVKKRAAKKATKSKAKKNLKKKGKSKK